MNGLFVFAMLVAGTQAGFLHQPALYAAPAPALNVAETSLIHSLAAPAVYAAPAAPILPAPAVLAAPAPVYGAPAPAAIAAPAPVYGAPSWGKLPLTNIHTYGAPTVLAAPDVRLYNGQIPTIAGAYAHHYAAPSYGFAVKK